MVKLDCYCGQSFEVQFPDTFDLDADPQLEQTILEGMFLSAQCPACGKTLKPELPVTITGPAEGLSLFLVPELDRGSFMRGAYDLGPVGRVVIGYPELVEKMTIRREGLDDRVIEVLKYYLASRALEEEDAPCGVRILFHGREGAVLLFGVEGLRRGEVGMTRVQPETYSKVEERLDEISSEEPFSEILKPPYVSVNRILDT